MATSPQQNPQEILKQLKEIEAFLKKAGMSLTNLGPLGEEITKKLKNIGKSAGMVDDSFEKLSGRVHTSDLELDKVTKKLIESIKSYGDVTKSSAADQEKAATELREAIKDNSKKQKLFTDSLRDIRHNSFNSYFEKIKLASDEMNDLTHNLAKQNRIVNAKNILMIKNSRDFDESSEQMTYANKQFTKVFEGMNKDMLIRNGLFNKHTEKLKQNLSKDELSNAALDLSETRTTILDMFKELGFNTMDDLKSSIDSKKGTNQSLNSKEVSSILSLLTTYKEKGYKFKEFEDFKGTYSEADQKEIDKDGGIPPKVWQDFLSDQNRTKKLFEEMSNNFKEEGVTLNEINKNIVDLYIPTESIRGAFKQFPNKLIEKFKEVAKTSGLINLSKETFRSIKADVIDFGKFNELFVPDSYYNTVTSGINMGLTRDEAISFAMDNKSSLTRFGNEKDPSKAMFETLKPFFNSYEDIGLTTKTVSGLIKDNIDLVESIGLNIKDKNIISDFSRITSKSFKDTQGILSDSPQEQLKILTDMIRSSDIQSEFLSLSKEERAARGKEIIALQDSIKIKYMDNKLAAEAVALAEKAKTRSVFGTMSETYKNAMHMRMLGIDDGSISKYVNLSNRPQGSLSNDDIIALQNIETNVKNVQSSLLKTKTNKDEILKYATSMVPFEFRHINDQLAIAEANAKTTGKATDAKSMIGFGANDKAAPNKMITTLNNLNNTMAALNSNMLNVMGPLKDAIMALSGGAIKGFGNGTLIGGSGISGFISGAMQFMAGGLGLAGLKTGFNKLFGTGVQNTGAGVGLLSKAGKFAMPAVKGLAGAGIGYLGNYAGDKIQESGNIKTGALMKILSSTIGGGVGGAGFGPWGALIGGGLGLATSLYSNWDDLWGINKNKFDARNMDVNEIKNNNINFSSKSIETIIEAGNSYLAKIDSTLTEIKDILSNKNGTTQTSMIKQPNTSSDFFMTKTSSQFLSNR